MTIEEINALTLEQTWSVILDRIVDTEGATPPYWYLSEEEGTLYERIVVSGSLTKPSLTDMNNELQLYKSELIDEYNRIQEEKRLRQEIKDRLDAIPYLRETMIEAGYNQPNSAIFVKDIIKNKDIQKLEALEAVASSVKTVVDEDLQISQSIEKGLPKIYGGLRVIALINSLNENKENLNQGEMQRLFKLYDPIIKSLITGSLKTALLGVQATRPDAIFTQSDKNKILKQINREIQNSYS